MKKTNYWPSKQDQSFLLSFRLKKSQLLGSLFFQPETGFLNGFDVSCYFPNLLSRFQSNYRVEDEGLPVSSSPLGNLLSSSGLQPAFRARSVRRTAPFLLPTQTPSDQVYQ